jgi:hypothetical protein
MTLEHFLSQPGSIVTGLHLLGVALGIGGATVADILFFRFLKNYRISKGEKSILEICSKILWLALLILFVTGIGLFSLDAENLLTNGKFQMKMIALGIIFVNGVALNMIVTPWLLKIPFDAPSKTMTSKVRLMRHLSFMLGAVSFVSWYFIFCISALRDVVLPLGPLFILYSTCIGLGIIGSQFFEQRISKKAHKEKRN